MKTTYLKEFIDYSKRKIAFVPLGTIEWHGNHLPVETDFLVAQKICEILAKKKNAYCLPPIYLGSGTKKKIKGKWFTGMDKYLEKKLSGNLYYLEPEFFAGILANLGKNLIGQGFEKIFVITGHGGQGQMKALSLAKKKLKKLVVTNIYEILRKEYDEIEHAGEHETSLFWACYPEEEAKSRKIKIKDNDDFFRYSGADPREKASLKLGKKLLEEIIINLEKIIK